MFTGDLTSEQGKQDYENYIMNNVRNEINSYTKQTQPSGPNIATISGLTAGGMLSGTYPDPSVASISGLAAGGDLTGTYPNPTITNITNAPIYNSNSTLSFRTSSTERMSIDASGRIFRPYQPICQLYNQTARGAGSPISWTNVYVNTGSMWGGGSRVTVPVTGTYLVTFEGMSDNTTGAAFYIDVHRNGSWITTARQYMYIASVAGHKQIALHIYTTLNASDYIEWVPNGGTAYADPNGYMHASVALVS